MNFRALFLVLIIILCTRCASFNSYRFSNDYKQIKRSVDSITILPPVFNIETIDVGHKIKKDSTKHNYLSYVFSKTSATCLSYDYTVFYSNKFVKNANDSLLIKEFNFLYYDLFHKNWNNINRVIVNDKIIDSFNKYSNRNYFLLYYAFGRSMTDERYNRSVIASVATVALSLATPIVIIPIPIKNHFTLYSVLIDRKGKRVIFANQVDIEPKDVWEEYLYKKSIDILLKPLMLTYFL